MKASPEWLKILIYWSKYWVDRLKKPYEEKFKQGYFINRYIKFTTIFYIRLPTSTATILVINSMNH